jgi:cell division inhibitor SepF
VSNLFGKFRDFVGFGTQGYYDDDGYDEMEAGSYSSSYTSTSAQPLISRDEELQSRQPEIESRPAMNTAMNNVVGMPGANKWWGAVAEVIVMEPREFEEMPQVIQALRDRKSVVLNLTMMEPDQAQRAVDFVAGATYTIDGHQERIGESIFLFTPSCVQVSTQSGATREAPQPQMSVSRPPTPAWTPEPVFDRIAQ